jgi:tyrosyl-tRNA synthetase
MKLFQDLQARGIVKQVTDPSLEGALDREKLTLYCGFDPTSDSLHIGSLLPLLTLRRFQLAGHQVIAVVGGATGMIGDPSFKAGERALLSSEQVRTNQEGISRVVSRFLETRGDNPAIVVNNADWFEGLSYVDFLRDVGKHFTVNHMMAKESVRARLEDRDHGISYTEFSYMLLQAYDFYVLNRDRGCRLQIGGSDQWGNITAGGELIRRMRASGDDRMRASAGSADAAKEGGSAVWGMTHPLVTKSDGTKFGKTESGAIWLDADKTSPFQFFQYFIQVSDSDVLTYLRFFTFLPHEELARLEATLKSAPEKREAQRTLARELTRMVHGDSELLRVEQASQALFGTEIRALDAKTLLELFKEAPSTEKARSALSAGYPLVDAMAESGLCASKGAARKDIAAGGVYVNNERISDVAASLRTEHLIADKYIVLRKGKKTYHLLSFSG